MINANSHAPTNLEKETLNSNLVQPTKMTNNVQASNVQLFHQKRSSSDLKWAPNQFDRAKAAEY